MYKVGDKVKVIRGNWCIIDNELRWFNEDTIGSTGVISEAHVTQGKNYYAMEPLVKLGVNLKHAWFSDKDLELIYRPDYELV